MVSKSEAVRVLKWLQEDVVLDYTETAILAHAASDPLTVTGRETAITIAKTQGAGEFLQHALNLLEKVAEEE